MKAYISKDTFVKGKPVFRGDSIEVEGEKDVVLLELQACDKVDKVNPFDPVAKGPEAKAAAVSTDASKAQSEKK